MESEDHSYPNEVPFRFRRRALAGRILLALLLSALCLWLGLLPDPHRPWLAILLPILAIFFGLSGLRFLVRMLSRRPAVVLTPDGIVNHSLPGGMKIEWRDIVAMFPVSRGQNRYVSLVLRDPNDFEARQPPHRRLWLRLYPHLSLAPFNIWTSALSVTPDEFWRQLAEYGRTYAPHLYLQVSNTTQDRRSLTGSQDAVDAHSEDAAYRAALEAVIRPAGQQGVSTRRRTAAALLQVLGIPALFLAASIALAIYLSGAHPELNAPLAIGSLLVGSVFLLGSLRRSRRALADFGVGWGWLIMAEVMAVAQRWFGLATVLGWIVGFVPLAGTFVAMSHLHRMLEDAIRDVSEIASGNAHGDEDDSHQ